VPTAQVSIPFGGGATFSVIHVGVRQEGGTQKPAPDHLIKGPWSLPPEPEKKEKEKVEGEEGAEPKEGEEGVRIPWVPWGHNWSHPH